MKIPYLMKDIKKAERKKLFTVVSSFAGGGGSSTGYRLAGADILAINEFIPEACATYAKNYPSTTIFNGDIRELTGQMILDELGLKKGELDLFDGSPPCSWASMAGIREKGWGKEKKYSSTKQRVDDLFFEYARVLRELEPKIFVAENTKGMLVGAARGRLGSCSMGFDLLDQASEQIIPVLKSCGYNVAYKVLNAADYGTPQARERTIIVGVHKKYGVRPTFPRFKAKKITTVGDILKNPYDIENDLINPHKEDGAGHKWLLQCAPGQKASTIHPNKSFFSYMRLHKDKVCPTICQASTLHYLLPDASRYLSINECKRIMGFPDDYKLTGSFNQQWERLGRAVAPPMYKYLGRHLYRTIIKKIKTGELKALNKYDENILF